MALNTQTSIVDYLKSKNQDSSYSNRSKLAQTHGISGYKGTAQQNNKLLNAIRSRTTQQPVSQPQPTPPPTTVTQPTQPVQQAPQQQVQQPSNPMIDQYTQESNDALSQYKDFLRSSSDAYYSNQQAMLEQQKAEKLSQLQKALNEAQAKGEISQQEAQRQLEREKEAINQGAYLNSQATELSAESRGIGNSQQLLAMQQGDKRHAEGLRSDARTQRDERINTIKDRLAQIENAYNLDVSTTNSAYNTGLQQARAQADMQFNQGMTNMNMQQYKNALQMKNNLTMEEQRQLNALERMEQQQTYTQDNINLQHNLRLDQMKTQQGYDLEKIDIQFDNQLDAMAKQYGYDLKKIGQQNANRLAQIKEQKNAQIEAQEKAYEQERQRVKDSYLNPSSDEYKIRMAQIEASEQEALNKYHQQALYESLNTVFNSEEYINSPAYDVWMENPGQVMQNPSQYTATGLGGYTELRAR